MGIFGFSKREKENWASIVISGTQPGTQIDDALLKKATDIYIDQHIRILKDSISLVRTSKNKKTREERYELALQHYGALTKIQKYADKKQKKAINDALDEFMIMNESYKHPERVQAQEKQEIKRQKRDAFWETYGTMEILDDIFNDKK